MIDVGRLNKRITFLKYTETENELGSTIQELAPYKTVWASVEPVNGKEYYEAQVTRNELTWNIYIRYSMEWTPDVDMIIQYGKRFFNIISIIDNREAHKLYKIVCTEKVENNIEF